MSRRSMQCWLAAAVSAILLAGCGDHPTDPSSETTSGPALPLHVRVVNVAAPEGGDGTSWPEAFRTLQDALSCVRGNTACAGVTELWVAKGVYYPDEGAGVTPDDTAATFTLVPGVSLYGGFAGTELAREQRNVTANVTILSGDITHDDPNTDGNFVLERAIDAVGANSTVVLTGTGTASSPVGRNTVVDGVTVTAGANSVGFGGGMRCTASGVGVACSPTISHVIFSGNSAQSGGAVALTPMNGASVAPVFADVTFLGNAAAPRDGGGGALMGSANGIGSALAPAFVRVAFDDNTAGAAGGAVEMYNVHGSCSAQFVGARFERNAAGDTGYGAAAMFGDCSTIMADALFWENKLPPTAYYGGAIAFAGLHDVATLTNVTFAGNDGGMAGGAIRGFNTDRLALILENVIAWGNSAATGPEVFAPAATILNSIVDGGCPTNATCLGVLASDPLFENLAAGDLRLRNISPAIDAGTLSALPSDLLDLDGDGDTTEPLPLDVALQPRVAGAGGKVDLGAHERQ